MHGLRDPTRLRCADVRRGGGRGRARGARGPLTGLGQGLGTDATCRTRGPNRTPSCSGAASPGLGRATRYSPRRLPSGTRRGADGAFDSPEANPGGPPTGPGSGFRRASAETGAEPADSGDSSRSGDELGSRPSHSRSSSGGSSRAPDTSRTSNRPVSTRSSPPRLAFCALGPATGLGPASIFVSGSSSQTNLETPIRGTGRSLRSAGRPEPATAGDATVHGQLAPRVNIRRSAETGQRSNAAPGRPVRGGRRPLRRRATGSAGRSFRRRIRSVRVRTRGHADAASDRADDRLPRGTPTSTLTCTRHPGTGRHHPSPDSAASLCSVASQLGEPDRSGRTDADKSSLGAGGSGARREADTEERSGKVTLHRRCGWT